MTEYRRFQHPGATWFFTVNLAERRGNRLLTDRVDALRAAFIDVKHKHPFKINAAVILPDHLHCIWTLPEGDSDFSTRWGLIKAHFSRQIAKGERLSKSREKRGERGLYPRAQVATEILGAPDSQRNGLLATCRLHSLESSQAWLGTMR